MNGFLVWINPETKELDYTRLENHTHDGIFNIIVPDGYSGPPIPWLNIHRGKVIEGTCVVEVPND